jgi:ribosomal protein L11 methyltransferase
VPYRIDLPDPSARTADLLIDLGALDIELRRDGLAALIPDAVPMETLRRVLATDEVTASPAVGRDDDSVWTLRQRAFRIGRFLIAPAGAAGPPADAVLLADRPAFGTGLHPTTALCLSIIDDVIGEAPPVSLLDVGTGSGILSLAALRGGISRAVGIDVDRDALRVAAENARLNRAGDRLFLVLGTADAIGGTWPLVVANIRAAELIEMAPSLVRRVGTGGRLVLSGIARAVAADVERAYRRLGLMRLAIEERDGWTALVFRPSW